MAVCKQLRNAHVFQVDLQGATAAGCAIGGQGWCKVLHTEWYHLQVLHTGCADMADPGCMDVDGWTSLSPLVGSSTVTQIRRPCAVEHEDNEPGSSVEHVH